MQRGGLGGLLLFALLAGCVNVAEEAVLDAVTPDAGLGLLGTAALRLEGGEALPPTTQVGTDSGLTLVSTYQDLTVGAEGERHEILEFEAEDAGSYGFTVDLDGRWKTGVDAQGALGFVPIDGLAFDTSGWTAEPELLRLDTIHLEDGVDIGSLVFVDADGRPVSGEARVEMVADQAMVLPQNPEVRGGRLSLDTRHARTGPAAVRLLDGTVFDLPGFEVHPLPDGITTGWSLRAEALEDEDGALALQLWFTAPDGGPLAARHDYGDCVQEDGRVIDLVALDGISTTEPGCEASACLDPAGEEHDLELCVGRACTTLRAPVDLGFREDPLNAECPWREG